MPNSREIRDKERKKRNKQTWQLSHTSHERTINSSTKHSKNRKYMIPNPCPLNPNHNINNPPLPILPSFAVATQ